jgi:hypothetical protein
MPACKPLLALGLAALCFGAAAQTTTSPGAAADAKARYQQERANCESGNTTQDKATCLREAGAALHESRRGGLTTSAQLEANAMSRCQSLPDADREDCRSRVKNDGNTTVKGTVQGGGVIKETTTRYVMTPEGEKRLP